MKQETLSAVEIRRLVDAWDPDLQERFAFRAKSLSLSMPVPSAVRTAFQELLPLHEERQTKNSAAA